MKADYANQDGQSQSIAEEDVAGSGSKEDDKGGERQDAAEERNVDGEGDIEMGQIDTNAVEVNQEDTPENNDNEMKEDATHHQGDIIISYGPVFKEGTAAGSEMLKQGAGQDNICNITQSLMTKLAAVEEDSFEVPGSVESDHEKTSQYSGGEVTEQDEVTEASPNSSENGCSFRNFLKKYHHLGHTD